MHTMTCLVLTAAAELRPVIGLTVIGAVFLPLWALEMGHNAAADLAAAVRRIPCNCNFHPLFFFSLFSLPSSILTLTWSFAKLPGAFEKPGQLPACNFKNTWLSMRKWAFHLSFCRNFCSLFFFFFCRYLFSPNSSVLLLALCLEGKFGLKSTSYKEQDHTWTNTDAGRYSCADSWLALTQSTYLIVFLPKCECQFTRWSGSTNPHHSSSDTPRTEIFGLYTTVADENTYIEPRAQRWKTHIMQSAHRLPIYTSVWLSSGILGWK